MTWRLAAAAFVGGVAIGLAGWWLLGKEEPSRSAAELMDVVMWGREPIGGAFALIDHDGQPRTDADFRGKVMLIYFGFTSCADICPTDLQAVAQALDRLGPDADAVQPLFITVNPELDTPEQLKPYVKLFHPRLIGLTGSSKQIKAVMRSYKVFAAPSEPSRRGGSQTDHSGLIYLVNAAGVYAGYFPPGTPPDRIVVGLRSEIAETQRAAPLLW